MFPFNKKSDIAASQEDQRWRLVRHRWRRSPHRLEGQGPGRRGRHQARRGVFFADQLVGGFLSGFYDGPNFMGFIGRPYIDSIDVYVMNYVSSFRRD